MATTKISLTKAMKLNNAGNVFFNEGKIERAIVKYSRAIDICPKNKRGEMAIFYQNRAACFDALNELQKVVDDCSDAIKLNNGYEKAYRRRSKAYDKLGRLRDALNDVASAHVVSGLSNKELIAEYNTILRKYSEKEGKRYFLSRAEVPLPDNVVRSHFQLFESNGFIDGDVDKEVLLCKIQELKLSNEENSFLKIHAIEGTISFLKLNYSDAEEHFNTVTKSECSKELKIYSFIILALCSFHAFLLGMRDETVIPNIMHYFESALSIDGNNGDVYFHRTPFIDYLNRGGYDRTIDHLKKCIAVSPNNHTAKAQMLYYRALKTLVTKDVSEINDVIKCFRQNLKVYPNSTAFMYFYLASVVDTFQKNDRARDCIKYVLQCKTSDKNFLVYKAFICQYDSSGWDTPERIRMYLDAVEDDEECQFGHEMLAFLYTSQFSYNEAIVHLRKALKVARTENECINLIRFKALLESHVAAVEKVKADGVIPSLFPVLDVHRLMKAFYDQIMCNWCVKRAYNGVPINCYRSKCL